MVFAGAKRTNYALRLDETMKRRELEESGGGYFAATVHAFASGTSGTLTSGEWEHFATGEVTAGGRRAS